MPQQSSRSRRAPHTLVAHAAPSGGDDAASSSEGNSDTAELKEMAAMDELIDVLLTGRTQQEVWERMQWGWNGCSWMDVAVSHHI